MTLQESVKHADEALLALESLGLPSFLQLQNFVWPFLLLGVVLVVGLGLSVGWTVGAIGGRRRSPPPRASAATSAWPSWPARAWRSIIFPLVASPRRMPSGCSTQTTDWVKTEYERQLKRGRPEPGERGQEGRGPAQSQRSPRPRPASSATRQEADAKYPARLAELRRERDAELKKAEDHYPPRIKALDEKYDSDNRAAPGVLPQDQGDDQAALRPGLEPT